MLAVTPLCRCDTLSFKSSLTAFTTDGIGSRWSQHKDDRVNHDKCVVVSWETVCWIRQTKGRKVSPGWREQQGLFWGLRELIGSVKGPAALTPRPARAVTACHTDEEQWHGRHGSSTCERHPRKGRSHRTRPCGRNRSTQAPELERN